MQVGVRWRENNYKNIKTTITVSNFLLILKMISDSLVTLYLIKASIRSYLCQGFLFEERNPHFQQGNGGFY